MHRALPLAVVLVLGGFGCSFDEVDLTGRGCPCIDGFECDTARNLCVAVGTVTDGAVDSPPPDADAGPRTSNCSGSLSSFDFCDGFEEEGLPLWSDHVGRDGLSDRVTDPTYLGEGAFSSMIVAGGGNAFRINDALAVSPGEEVFWRMYLLVPSTFDIVGLPIFTISSDTPDDVILWGLGPDGVGVGFIGMGPLMISGTGVLVPRDTWVCVRGRVSIEVGAATMAMQFGDEEVINATNLGTLPTTPFNHLIIGVVTTDPTQPPAQILMDEVVVDVGSAIPCD